MQDCVLRLFYSFFEVPPKVRKVETVSKKVVEKVLENKMKGKKEEKEEKSDPPREDREKNSKNKRDKSKEMKQGKMSGKREVDASDVPLDSSRGGGQQQQVTSQDAKMAAGHKRKNCESVWASCVSNSVSLTSASENAIKCQCLQEVVPSDNPTCVSLASSAKFKATSQENNGSPAAVAETWSKSEGDVVKFENAVKPSEAKVMKCSAPVRVGKNGIEKSLTSPLTAPLTSPLTAPLTSSLTSPPPNLFERMDCLSKHTHKVGGKDSRGVSNLPQPTTRGDAGINKNNVLVNETKVGNERAKIKALVKPATVSEVIATSPPPTVVRAAQNHSRPQTVSTPTKLTGTPTRLTRDVETSVTPPNHSRPSAVSTSTKLTGTPTRLTRDAETSVTPPKPTAEPRQSVTVSSTSSQTTSTFAPDEVILSPLGVEESEDGPKCSPPKKTSSVAGTQTKDLLDVVPVDDEEVEKVKANCTKGKMSAAETVRSSTPQEMTKQAVCVERQSNTEVSSATNVLTDHLCPAAGERFSGSRPPASVPKTTGSEPASASVVTTTSTVSSPTTLTFSSDLCAPPKLLKVSSASATNKADSSSSSSSSPSSPPSTTVTPVSTNSLPPSSVVKSLSSAISTASSSVSKAVSTTTASPGVLTSTSTKVTSSRLVSRTTSSVLNTKMAATSAAASTHRGVSSSPPTVILALPPLSKPDVVKPVPSLALSSHSVTPSPPTPSEVSSRQKVSLDSSVTKSVTVAPFRPERQTGKEAVSVTEADTSVKQTSVVHRSDAPVTKLTIKTEVLSLPTSLTATSGRPVKPSEKTSEAVAAVTSKSTPSHDVASRSHTSPKISPKSRGNELVHPASADKTTSKKPDSHMTAVHPLPKTISQPSTKSRAGATTSTSGGSRSSNSSILQTTKITTLMPKWSSVTAKSGLYSKSLCHPSSVNNIPSPRSFLHTAVTPHLSMINGGLTFDRSMMAKASSVMQTPLTTSSPSSSSSSSSSSHSHKSSSSSARHKDSDSKEKNSKVKTIPPLSIPKSCLIGTTLKLQRSPGSTDHYIFAPHSSFSAAASHHHNGERSKSSRDNSKHHNGTRTPTSPPGSSGKDSVFPGERQRVPTIKISDINRNPIIVDSGSNHHNNNNNNSSNNNNSNNHHHHHHHQQQQQHHQYRSYGGHGSSRSSSTSSSSSSSSTPENGCSRGVGRALSRGSSDSGSPPGPTDRSPARDSRRPSDSELLLNQHWHGYPAELIFNGFKIPPTSKFPDLHYDTDAMPLDYSQSSSKS